MSSGSHGALGTRRREVRTTPPPLPCPPDVPGPSRRDGLRSLNAGEVSQPAAPRPALLPAELIHDDEVIVLMLRPSPLYMVLSSLGGLVCIAAITFALAWMTRLSWVGWSEGQAFVLGLSLTTLRVGWQGLEWFSRVYVLTDRRVICRQGVLRVVLFQAPLRNIQHVTVFRRLRERLFGLGTIGFATAGSDGFEALWVMIGQPFAVHRLIGETMEKYR